MVTTQPNIHHIHVDATWMTEKVANAFLGLGILDTPFSGHPEGYDHFEPNRHMTIKIIDGRTFLQVWNRMVEIVEMYPGEFRGYLEGERIPVDIELAEATYVDLPIPFTLSRRRLDPSRGETFREKEIHLTLNKDRSHPEIIRKLLQMGLYGAYVEKADHTALVLTAQGDAKTVDNISAHLLPFLEASGGIVAGTFKDEFAIKHLIHGVAVTDLPEVVDKVLLT